MFSATAMIILFISFVLRPRRLIPRHHFSIFVSIASTHLTWSWSVFWAVCCRMDCLAIDFRSVATEALRNTGLQRNSASSTMPCWISFWHPFERLLCLRRGSLDIWHLSFFVAVHQSLQNCPFGGIILCSWFLIFNFGPYCCSLTFQLRASSSDFRLIDATRNLLSAYSSLDIPGNSVHHCDE